MSITVSDLSSAVWNYLNTSDDAATYRGVLQAGVLEAGFADQDTLNAAEVDRRAAGSAGALVATVQDAGDEYMAVNNGVEFVVIRHYDRGYGYRHLRTAREYLKAALKRFRNAYPTLTAMDGERRGILELRYEGRTGHRYDRAYACDWEAISYRAILALDEE